MCHANEDLSVVIVIFRVASVQSVLLSSPKGVAGSRWALFDAHWIERLAVVTLGCSVARSEMETREAPSMTASRISCARDHEFETKEEQRCGASILYLWRSFSGTGCQHSGNFWLFGPLIFGMPWSELAFVLGNRLSTVAMSGSLDH